jgi:Cu(I)/Ag(I) efflux system membrane fusion protein
MKTIKTLMMAAFTILSLAVFAQANTKTSVDVTKHKKDKQTYNCPMHASVTSDKPGKCSQCGMNLMRSPKEKMKMETVKMYSCPMHPAVSSTKPGKCPECGMELKKTANTTKAYSCPMHPDVTSDKPGKCTKCGNDLMRSPKEKMKMEVMKIYSCPMHPDVTSDKPGKCSKCGMDFKERRG